MKYQDLPKNNKVCIRAWAAIHTVPTGEVLPCCHTAHIVFDAVDNSKALSHQININHNSLDTIRNQDVWRELRRDMILGVENPICKTCWNFEKTLGSSYRIQANNIYQSDLNNLDFNEAGTISTTDPVVYWDIRDSNLCNMKCVMCGPGYSSMYQQESIDNSTNKKLPYPMSPVRNHHGELVSVVKLSNQADQQILKKLQDNISSVKEIYFAGGEPIINDMHYNILDLLIAHGRVDCSLSYNTNLLKLSHRGVDLLEAYWGKFKRVAVRASIDSTGARAEWARNGTKWDVINNNADRLVEFSKKYNNINVGVNATTSMYTLAGLPELISWFESKQFNGGLTMSNVLHTPAYYQIKVLPRELRQHLWNQLNEFINTVNNKHRYTSGGDRSGHAGWPAQWDLLEKIILEAEPENVKDLRSQAKTYITSLDNIRNTNILEACPEFQEFWHTW